MCVFVYVCVSLPVCMFVCVYVFVRVYVCLCYVCEFVHMYVCMYIYVCLCVSKRLGIVLMMGHYLIDFHLCMCACTASISNAVS